MSHYRSVRGRERETSPDPEKSGFRRNKSTILPILTAAFLSLSAVHARAQDAQPVPGNADGAADMAAPAPVSEKIDLMLEKKALNDCVAGEVCNYEITITNLGPDVYKGPVFIKDIYSPLSAGYLSGQKPETWSCAEFEDPEAPVWCRRDSVKLASGERVILKLSLTARDDYEGTGIRNCAEIFWPMLDPVDPVRVNKAVQRTLVLLGYDAGKPDGTVGPQTADAIRQFQKDSGLAETGLVNDALLLVLFPDSAGLAGDQNPENDGTCGPGFAGNAVEPLPAAPLPVVPPVVVPPVHSRALTHRRRGSPIHTRWMTHRRRGSPVHTRALTHLRRGSPVHTRRATHRRRGSPVHTRWMTHRRRGSPVHTRALTHLRRGSPVHTRRATHRRRGSPIHTRAATHRRRGSPVHTRALTHLRRGSPVHTRRATHRRRGSPVHTRAATHRRRGSPVHTRALTHLRRGSPVHTRRATHRRRGSPVHTRALTHLRRGSPVHTRRATHRRRGSPIVRPRPRPRPIHTRALSHARQGSRIVRPRPRPKPPLVVPKQP